jgi:hypothetical protein
MGRGANPNWRARDHGEAKMMRKHIEKEYLANWERYAPH